VVVFDKVQVSIRPVSRKLERSGQFKCWVLRRKREKAYWSDNHGTNGNVVKVD
jgi:hypothetical protein